MLKNTYKQNQISNKQNCVGGEKEFVQRNLLQWFYENKRDLPFRKTRDPYHIWVSEIMLQQTRVAAMTKKFSGFILHYPNIKILSESNEEEIFSYWQGLGYYSRAKNLLKGARYVMENFQGYFPADMPNALKIPGIGSYTASAILSIAYNVKTAVLDGNVKRVLSRLFQFTENISLPSSTIELKKLAEDFLNPEFPGDHNQALMELGALVCFVKPNCKQCPIALICTARINGIENTLPVKEKQRPDIKIDLHFLFYSNKDKLLLIKDKNRRFFKTIYSLPYRIKCDDCGYTNPGYIEEMFANRQQNIINHKTDKLSHTITHHKINLSASETIASEKNVQFPEGVEIKWIDRENLIKEFPSSIASKLYNNFSKDSLCNKVNIK